MWSLLVLSFGKCEKIDMYFFQPEQTLLCFVCIYDTRLQLIKSGLNWSHLATFTV